MKPPKERLDEAALVFCSNPEYDTGQSLMHDYLLEQNRTFGFKAGANWMQAEMQNEIDELVKALEFYADEGSWRTHNGYEIFCAFIDEEDEIRTSEFGKGYGHKEIVGGKRAREALAKYKGVKDE